MTPSRKRNHHEGILRLHDIKTELFLVTLDKSEGGFSPTTWRKLKGRARIELSDGDIIEAELHWYEAHGIGRVDMKVKRLLEE